MDTYLLTYNLDAIFCGKDNPRYILSDLTRYMIEII